MYQLQINSKDHEIQVFQLNNQDEGCEDEEATQEKAPIKEDASEFDDMQCKEEINLPEEDTIEAKN